MTGYPLLLDLTGRRVVVVGGGAVALRRAGGLVEAGALVHVIAPSVLPALAALGVAVHRRRYADGDLAGAWLAHACTDDPAVNAAVAAEAERHRVPCVRADAAAGGTARTPATARSGGLTVAVNADGDPARAVALRDAVMSLLAAGQLPVRHRRPPSGGPVAGQAGSAADPATGAVAEPATGPVASVAGLAGGVVGPVGSVALVGGGPGDPELITVRGRRLLAEADVVVVDRLAPQALLAELDPAVEVVGMGKAPHGEGATQEQINALLVDRARAGKRVVRLKGGDPFVFGRGGEEVAACVAAGVPVEVVPGISSALAGPAAAGIPVTHRGLAADFAVVSGHLDPTRPGSTVDWQALADGPATLVLLMALDQLAAVATELVKRGRPAGTPVAVIRNATRADQQVLVATLGTVAAEVTRAGLRPPAVVVVGEVVRLRGDLWSAPA
ncbi:MAG TPA: uroporphyrinogen-III C-methyltransferase [Mycobacteriales bacterium]|nr:uroporphyrinogen-III C-methyltransferase [Mycobacteriales bacterium]